MTRFVLLCIYAVFFVASAVPIIDYQNQEGGDIRLPEEEHLKPSTEQVYKWDEIRDDDGNYIIPFVMSKDFYDDEPAIIYDAMHEIEANTCIRFRNRSNEETFVDIINVEGKG
ncbi:hypothetical protein ANCDUO_08362, partial [Ancylostoma duodenale]